MSDDALGAQKIQQQRSAKEAGAEKAANRTTMRNPKLEGDTQGDHPRGQARISDGHHVTNRNLPGSLSGVRLRHARIFMAKQVRVSSLLAPHGPHIGHICSTPQAFIMTALRRTDATEFTRGLCVPRRKRASPLCRCSRCEASQESSAKMVT